MDLIYLACEDASGNEGHTSEANFHQIGTVVSVEMSSDTV